MATLPTYFVSHGGGPWPWMREQYGPVYDKLAASLAALRREADAGGTVRAVLVVSSHWEAPQFMVSSGTAPGEPALARRVAELLNAAGHPAGLDPERGFDHGTFSMLYPVYPEARMPVVQLSLRRDLDPAAHLAAGRALAPLRDDGVLIIGSGLSFHNLRQFGTSGKIASHAFDAWLQDTLLEHDPVQRAQLLLRWDAAPQARAAHPREEHLIPLLVALGAAEREPAACVYHEDDFFGSLAVSSFRFGAAAGA